MALIAFDDAGLYYAEARGQKSGKFRTHRGGVRAIRALQDELLLRTGVRLSHEELTHMFARLLKLDLPNHEPRRRQMNGGNK